ncbi:MAG: peptidylprolyl isomerase [Gemmatimonadales bacterium]
MTRRVWPAGLAIALPLVALSCGRGEGSRDEAAAPPGNLREPASPAMRLQAPRTFRVRFETSAGDFVVEVRRDWAPLGADRFYNLARSSYFDGVRFFRVLPGFVAQFGIHGDPQVSALWREQAIRDDPVRHSNGRGTLSFATAGPDTRTTQLFINFRDNDRLDGMGFSPIGQVVAGMDVVDKLYAGYGEGEPAGRGPSQDRMQAEGNAYLERDFAELDYVKRATVTAR